MDQRGGAGDGKLCLGLAVDDLQIEADLVADALDEDGAVGGHAAGLGGDEADAADLPPAQLVGAHPEGGDGALHRFVAERARGGRAFTQAHDAREGIDNGEPAWSGLGHQQTAVVGTKIEGAIKATAPRTLPGGGCGADVRLLRPVGAGGLCSSPHRSQLSMSNRPDDPRAHIGRRCDRTALAIILKFMSLAVV